MVHLEIGNIKISTTTKHPFWIEGKGWIGAGDLNIGDVVTLANGENAEVTNITIEKLAESVKVYNFEVSDWHTYYVADIGVLVHNTCGGKSSSKADGRTYSVNGEILNEKQFSSIRQKAVRQAWRQEKELVTKTGRGTRDWNQEEIQELLAKGKVKGYEGQHMKSAKEYPDFAGDPNNIQFLKGRNMRVNEHLDAHGGNYVNPTNGYYDPNSGNFVDFGNSVPWK